MNKSSVNKREEVNTQPVRSAHIPGMMSEWEVILTFCLASPLGEFGGHAEKIRLLYQNYFEFFEAYGQLKEAKIEELDAVLYFLGKKYESDSMPPTGAELKFLHLVLNKLKSIKDAS